MGIYTNNPGGKKVPPQFPRPTQGIYEYRRPDGSSYKQFGDTCKECADAAEKKWNEGWEDCSDEIGTCVEEMTDKLKCNCNQMWSEYKKTYIWKLSCTLPGNEGCGMLPEGGEFKSEERCQAAAKNHSNSYIGVQIEDCCMWKKGWDPVGWPPPPTDNCISKMLKEYENRIVPEWADCVNFASDGWGGNYEPPPCGSHNPPGLPGGPGGETTWPPPLPPTWWQ